MSVDQLSAWSDPVAFVALAVLAIVFGFLPVDLVMPCWLRKRPEVALIWGVACLNRLARACGLVEVASLLHVVSAVVAVLAATTAVRSLLRVRHDQRR